MPANLESASWIHVHADVHADSRSASPIDVHHAGPDIKALFAGRPMTRLVYRPMALSPGVLLGSTARGDSVLGARRELKSATVSAFALIESSTMRTYQLFAHQELNSANVSAFSLIESSTVRMYQLFRCS